MIGIHKRVPAFLVVILITVSTVAAKPWTIPTYVDLTGIPAPYSFRYYCSVDSIGIWNVHWKYISFDPMEGVSRESSPVEEELDGIYFVNPQLGWVVGWNGIILHTRDGGFNWVQQNSGVEKNLLAVTCLDEKSCWIVGASGIVLHTNDGGLEWKRVETNISENLNAVSFINDREGWAVGPDALVVHTQDGGKTWDRHQIKLPLYIREKYEGISDLYAILFIDEKRGWIGGMHWIAWTTDSGQSWSRKKVEGDIIGFVTQDGEKIWAINDAAIDIGERNYFSSDGGKSWKKWNPPKDKPKQVFPKDAT